MSGSGSGPHGWPESVPTGSVLAQTGSSLDSATGATVPHFTPGDPPSPCVPSLEVPDHELLYQIGGGSYGEVWLARSRLGTLRAVKVVRRGVFGDSRPFEREYRGIRHYEPISRSHEGLVDILQVGGTSEFFYCVMELADSVPGFGGEGRGVSSASTPEATEEARRTEEEGRQPPAGASISVPSSATSPLRTYAPRTLRAELCAHDRLPPEECVRVGVAIVGALAYLHQHGLVHRDVKPSNIIFVAGVPKLADIGLVADESEARSFVGTEGFIPPEGPGRPQADLYSLGKVLYEASTGKDRRDFPELPTDFASKAEEDAFLELNAVILKACHANRQGRYRTAEEMAADLALLEQGRSVKRRRARARQLGLLGKAAVVVGVIAVGTWFGPRVARRLDSSPTPAPVPLSIAILPFRADGTNAQHNGLCERIADAFATALGELDGVSVAKRKWAYALTETNPNLAHSADRLGVSKAVVVRLSRPADSYRLSVSLMGFPDGKVVGERSYEATLTNLVEVELQAVGQLATRLGIPLTEEARQRSRGVLVNNLDAYVLVREAWGDYLRQTREGYTQASRKLDQARRLDARYLEIHRLLAQIYYEDPDVAPIRIWTAVNGETQRALEIDDTCPWAISLRAGYMMTVERDWAAGRALRLRAAALDPGHVHPNVALDLAAVGRLDEAGKIWERFYREEPGSFYSCSGMITHLFNRRDYKSALALSEKSLERFSDAPWFQLWIARCLEQSGRLDEAERSIRLARIGKDEPWYQAIHGHICVLLGKTEEAATLMRGLEQLAEQRYVDPAHRAAIRVAMGEEEQAFAALGRSIEDCSEVLGHCQLMPLRYDPYWDPLRDDPRFPSLMRRLGLDP